MPRSQQLSRADYRRELRDLRAPRIDADGVQVGSVSAVAMCLWPRRPSSLSIESPDGRMRGVVPCGFCAGCRELARQRLAKRLAAHYGRARGELWLVLIDSPVEEHARLATSVRRSLTTRSWRGFFRIGASCVAFIADGPRASQCAPRSRIGRKARFYPVRRPSRPRAWRLLTRGLAVVNDEFPKWANRYYHRGLPRPEKRTWILNTTSGVRSRSGSFKSGVRAVYDEVAITTPRDLRIPRLKRRCGPVLARSSVLEKIGGILSALVPLSPRGYGFGLTAAAPTSPRNAEITHGARVDGGGHQHDPVRAGANSYSRRGYKGSLHISLSRPQPRGRDG